MFVRVSILPFSMIFLLDCGVNVLRGDICLLGYQFCPFLRFFYWIVVEMFRRSGIFCLFYILLKKINENSTMLKGTQEESIEP